MYWRVHLAFLVLFALSSSSLVACADEKSVPPTASPLPIATATATPPALKPIIDPLLESAEAVAQLSSVLYQRVWEDVITTETRESVIEFKLGDEEVFHLVEQWSGDSQQETVCVGNRIKRCWGRVGEHPWLREFSAEQYTFTFAQSYEQFVQSANVIETEESTDGTKIIVTWTGEAFPFFYHAEEVVENGRIWLQADTYLPLRIVQEGRATNDDRLIYVSETNYEAHNMPLTIATPVAELVDPVPRAMPADSTLAVHFEEPPAPGRLFVPDVEGLYTAVLVLHGSEGGLSFTNSIARQLAESGFVVLAYCYFGCPDTPETLENIDLDSIIETLQHLQNRPDVNPNSLAVVGVSRGAELALIMGVLYPDVGAVASLMGSPYVTGGLPNGGVAWRYQDEPLPFWNIPVEMINGPVLLMHGSQDRLWPASFSYHLADRLEAHDHPYELIILPNREHDLGREGDVGHITTFLRESLP